jgi:hypothetical protein
MGSLYAVKWGFNEVPNVNIEDELVDCWRWIAEKRPGCEKMKPGFIKRIAGAISVIAHDDFPLLHWSVRKVSRAFLE